MLDLAAYASSSWPRCPFLLNPFPSIILINCQFRSCATITRREAGNRRNREIWCSCGRRAQIGLKRVLSQISHFRTLPARKGTTAGAPPLKSPPSRTPVRPCGCTGWIYAAAGSSLAWSKSSAKRRCLEEWLVICVVTGRQWSISLVLRDSCGFLWAFSWVLSWCRAVEWQNNGRGTSVLINV